MNTNRRRSLPEQLRRVVAVYVFASTAVAFLVFSISTYLGWNGPLERISFRGDDLPDNIQSGCFTKPFGSHYFGDFLSTICHSQLNSPFKSTEGTNYFPFAYVLFRPLSFLAEIHILFAYLPFLILVSSSILILISQRTAGAHSAIERAAIAGSLVFLSQPLLSAFDRGNIQALVVLLCGLGVFLDFEGDDPRATSRGGYLLVGLAGAIKGYPILFLLLWALKKQHRQFILGLVTAGLLSLVSLFSFAGGFGINLRAFVADIRGFGVSDTEFLQINSSLRALLVGLREVHLQIVSAASLQLLRFDNLIRLCLILIMLAVAALSRESVFRVLLCISMVIWLLLNFNPPYALAIFLIPTLEVFGSVPRSGRRTDLALTVLLFSLLLPKFGLIESTQSASISVLTILNPLLILMMIGLLTFDATRTTHRAGHLRS